MLQIDIHIYIYIKSLVEVFKLAIISMKNYKIVFLTFFHVKPFFLVQITQNKSDTLKQKKLSIKHWSMKKDQRRKLKETRWKLDILLTRSESLEPHLFSGQYLQSIFAAKCILYLFKLVSVWYRKDTMQSNSIWSL